MQTDPSFGHRLKHYRQAQDLTQADLAERVNCATESIRKMEANRQRPSKFLAARLADILSIPPTERPDFLRLARARVSTPTQANLPAIMTSLVGRRKELEQACALLRRPDVRLVTLTGPGGVGKTRLATQIATELLNETAYETYFVALASVTDASLVPSAIARTLHLREADEHLVKHLSRHLHARQVLLILDNFEHVPAATPFLATLLEAAPRLHILVTSRTALHLYGEHELSLPPLAVPDLKHLPPSSQLNQYESVSIFVNRAQAVKADFAVTESNAQAIAEICYRLDGLPLALELAAAYAKLLSPNMILERLKKEPIGLATPLLNVPERHQTLRQALDWSYQLLNADEQGLFRQLSVFVGGCTLAGVEAVCGADDPALLTHLGSLLDKSLLQRVEVAVGEPRFTMLETVRTYALEQLQGSEESESVHQRHLAYYLKLGREAVPQLAGLQQWRELELLEQEINNLRAAIQWALGHNASEAVVRLCNDLQYFWYEFGRPSELYQWMEAVLAQESNLPAAVKAEALRFTGYVLVTMEIDYPRAQTFYEEALRLWREIGSQPHVANTLVELGLVMMELGHYEQAQRLYEECLTIWKALGDTAGALSAQEWLGVSWMRQGEPQRAAEVFETSVKLRRQQGDLRALAFSLNYLGVIEMYRGRNDQARLFLEEALALWRTIGDLRGVSSALNALGPVALYQGDAGQAYTFLSQSLSLRWENQDYNGIAWNLERLAEVAFALGQLERGAQLWGAAETLREKHHSPLFPADRSRYEPVVNGARSTLGEVAWAVAYSSGRAKPLEEVVGYALEG